VFLRREAIGFARTPFARQSKLFRTEKPQRTVGLDGIVVDAPRFDTAPGLGEIDEPTHCSFRRTSRNLPLNLSTKAFCMGFPGWMNRSLPPVRYDYRNMALLVNSGPLPIMIISGRPRSGQPVTPGAG